MNDQSSRRRLDKREMKFALLFVLTLLVAFSPSTPLGQVSALAFLFAMIFYVQVRPNYHLKKYLIILAVYTVIGFAFWLLYQQDFSFINYYLFFATASSFLLLFFDFRPVISDGLLERLGQITLVFLFLESLLGIYQATYVYLRSGTFDGSAGDFVWGTLAPSFNTAFSGRSPSFVLLVSTLLLFSLATFRRHWTPAYLFAYGSVLVAWVLASLMHSYLYFGIAAILALMTLLRVNVRKKKVAATKAATLTVSYGGLVTITTVIALALILPRVLPHNTAKIEFALREASNLSPDARFLKNRAAYSTLFDLHTDARLQPIVGVGPGQYASRAALMATGQYLTRPIPGLPEHVSSFTNSYILPHLNVIRSSLHLPSSSWLAIYGESGLLGLVVSLFIGIKAIIFFRSYRSGQFRMLNLMMLILIYYLILMAFQNVYFEYTQALLPAILGVKLCFDFLHKEFGLPRSRPVLKVKPRQQSALQIQHRTTSD